VKQPLFFILFIFSLSTYAQTTFTSVTTGDWDDGATWGNTSPGVQGTDWPAATDHAVIASGHTVSLTSAETIVDLTVNVGGVFDDDNRGDITVDGNLVINGTVTGNRNIQFTGGSGQTIDGTGVHNSAGDIVANGTTVIASTASLTLVSNFDLSGVTVTNNGTITVNTSVTGNASTTWINAANSTLKIGSNLLNGAGTLTASASGNTVTYIKDGGQAIKIPTGSTYYSLTIEGTGAKTISADLTISGDLTITSGELDTNSANLTIGGDFINSGGTFTENSNLVTFNGTGSQSITTTTSETFYDFTINKASGTLSLASDVIVSNTLTMTNGVLDAGANTLTLGTGTGVEGILAYTAGQIVGLFERWVAIGTATTDVVFPVGSASNPNSVTINFTGITSGGTVLFQFLDSDPGNAGLSLDDAGTTIYNTFVDGYWEMSMANGFNLTGGQTYSLDLDGTGFGAFTIDAATRLLTRANAGSNWTAEGTHVAAVNPTAMRTGLTSEGAQYAFGDDTNCTGPTTSAITGSSDVCTSDLNSAYSVTLNAGNTYTWTVTGGTIDAPSSGVDVNNITVDWGGTGVVGSVSVVETNGCTSGATVSLSVDVNSIAPTSITGKTNVAESTTGEPYSVTNRAGYTYTWTISGGTQASGGTTNSITVDWGTAGVGNISVVAQKAGCSVATAYNIDVTKYIVINSAQTGNWGSGTTWVTGSVPLTTENARILNSHTVTFTADETIVNFIIDAGGTVTTTNKILNVDGDFTVNGTYSGGTKALDIQGVNATIDGTGTISVSGANVQLRNGNKSIASTAVLSITAGNFEFKEAGITLTNNGSISVTADVVGLATSTWTNSANSTLKVGGVLGLTTGIFNASASGNTVEYNGTGAQTIISPASSTYFNLAASTSGTKTTAASLDINGDLTISGTAILDVNANTSDLTVAGNWSNSGTFTQGGQTVTLDGAASQTINGSTTTTFNNLIINNSVSGDAVTLNSPAIVNTAFTLSDGIVLTTSTNIISLATAATTSGYSDASFVNGPMTYNSITSSTVTFPVGKDSEVHRLDLTVNGTGSNYTTEYIHSSATALGYTLPGTIDKVSGIGYWDVTRAAGGTVTTAAVDLYYNSNDVVSEASTLRVAKDDGAGNWLDLGGTGTASPAGNILSTTNFTAFSSFSLANNTGGLNALPVELVFFKGNISDQGVILRWQTASEWNNDYFDIEVSSDGEYFKKIAQVMGKGTTNKVSNYEYLDRFSSLGLNYYRLKQVDFDGSFALSNTILVVNNIEPKLVFSAYPQPASNQLTIRLSAVNDEAPLHLFIFNMNGTVVKNILLDPNTRELIFDASSLTEGLYLVRLKQTYHSYNGKLLIKR
jgi:type IX secretion system substrate protein